MLNGLQELFTLIRCKHVPSKTVLFSFLLWNVFFFTQTDFLPPYSFLWQGPLLNIWNQPVSDRFGICKKYPGRFRNEISVWRIKTAKLYFTDIEVTDRRRMCCFCSYNFFVTISCVGGEHESGNEAILLFSEGCTDALSLLLLVKH